MFGIARSQLLAYAAVAAAVAVVGIGSLRGGGRAEDPPAAGASGALAAGNGEAGGGAGTGGGADAGAGGLTISGGGRPLVVDVSGAVARPGVYRLPEGSRVIDAIRRAGGPARGALAGAINRAARLTDGQQVVVPLRAGGPDGGAGAAGAAATAGVGSSSGGAGAAGGAAGAPISLGTATAAQLEGIDGIGPVTAAKIIEFRDSKGGLGSIEELDQVSGIGPVTMESLRSALQP